MRLAKIGKGVVLAVCLALAVVFVSGCLVADKTVAAAYDAGTDSFRFLIVFQRISTEPDKAAEDMQWLRALYANRDHLILMPAGSPSPLDGMFEGATLRLSNQKLAYVDLSAADKTGLLSQSAPIDLDQIAVLPGEFFMGGKGNVCYFQQVVVPGKSADAMLDYVSHQLKSKDDTIAGAIDAELGRRTGGEAQGSWDEFTREIIAQTIASPEQDQSGASPPSDPLDAQSLRLLRGAMVGGRLDLRRVADKIQCSAQMTEADVSGLLGFLDAYRKATGGHAADSPMVGAVHKMLQSVAVTVIDKTHIRVTIDVPALFNAFYGPLDPLQPRDESKLESVADVGGFGLPVDRDLTLQKLVGDFKAGKLKAYLPAQSVEPGAGLGAIHPATQPEGSAWESSAEGKFPAAKQ